MTTRVLIADDHELVRRGLRSLLESRPGWEICGEAKDGMEAVEMTKALVPDLILLDITMPRLNGLDAARRIRKEVPQTQILILSQHDIEEMSASALEAGARAYVSKSDVAITLFSSMEAILRVRRTTEGPPMRTRFSIPFLAFWFSSTVGASTRRSSPECTGTPTRFSKTSIHSR